MPKNQNIMRILEEAFKMRKSINWKLIAFDRKSNAIFSENLYRISDLMVALNGIAYFSSESRDNLLTLAADKWLDAVEDSVEVPQIKNIVVVLKHGDSHVGYCTYKDNDIFVPNSSIDVCTFYRKYNLPMV